MNTCQCFWTLYAWCHTACFSSCKLLFSLNIMFVQFIHVDACSSGSSILIDIVFHKINVTCLFIHSSFDGHLDCYLFFWLLVNTLKHISSYSCAKVYLGIYLGEKLLSFRLCLPATFQEKFKKLFKKKATSINTSTSITQTSLSSTSSPDLSIVGL